MFLIARSWGIALHPARECRVPALSGRNRPSTLLYSKSSRLTCATEARSSGRLELSRVIEDADQCKPGASPGFVSRRIRPQSLLPHHKQNRPEIPDTALILRAGSGSFWKQVLPLRSKTPRQALDSALPRARVSRLIH